ncbi:MAG: STAS domain-containing protein [Betaproteobacteria bacterium]|nr:STAS domain-containing protein [Betaproteobacteria bacterium]
MTAKPAVSGRPKDTPKTEPPVTIRSESVSNNPATQNRAADKPRPQLSDRAPAEAPIVPFSDFSELPGKIEVLEDSDPIETDIEQAAVLYANSQDSAARSLLEDSIRIHRYGPGERLWLMLFELYRLTAQKTPFEVLALDYAKSFEKSPPIWSLLESGEQKPAPKPNKIMRSSRFSGNLLGSNDEGFAVLEANQERSGGIRADLTEVHQVDDAGCIRMLNLLAAARKQNGRIELKGDDGLAQLLEARLQSEQRTETALWRLLLELYQMQGKMEVFEDRAIDFAVTFEVSPPSWEPSRVLNTEFGADSGLGVTLQEPEEDPPPPPPSPRPDYYRLEGELKAARFEELPEYAETHNPVVIDFSAVKRIDFVSAGLLVNLLTKPKRGGRKIMIFHPNLLVAALLHVLGIDSVASILPAQR